MKTYEVHIYNLLNELVFYWKLKATNRTEVLDKVREVYPIVTTDRMSIVELSA